MTHGSFPEFFRPVSCLFWSILAWSQQQLRIYFLIGTCCSIHVQHIPKRTDLFQFLQEFVVHKFVFRNFYLIFLIGKCSNSLLLGKSCIKTKSVLNPSFHVSHLPGLYKRKICYMAKFPKSIELQKISQISNNCKNCPNWSESNKLQKFVKLPEFPNISYICTQFKKILAVTD